MRDEYLLECERIQDNCTYTAETHHVIAKKNKKVQIYFQLIPAIITTVLVGVMTASNFNHDWMDWLALASLISAVTTAVSAILDPQKEYYDHLNAAKNFVVLKQDARALRETFCFEMDDATLSKKVRYLHDRYNDLVRFVPPTDDGSMEKARKRIKAGIHKPDKQ
jgi:hypothetical protein